jgi:EAL domain-containing protein (putative c-di-GMP-specific phosphodiesterase class I)
MYYAKQLGRNNFQCFMPRMTRPPRRRSGWKATCTCARTKQFELHYQPKVNTATGVMHGAEALLRWTHPVLGRSAGQIHSDRRGMRVDRRARRLGHARSLPAGARLAGRGPAAAAGCRQSVGFAVSSGQHRLDDSRRAGYRRIEARFLEVELTESVVMSDPEESIAILEKLSTMGVLVSIDDFGTGYSSMSYLRRFPIDKIKIDRAFISEAISRPDDASIVRAIVSLAHSLRLKVVAEGVESPRAARVSEDAGLRSISGLSLQQGAASGAVRGAGAREAGSRGRAY